ncbi:MAG: hypothetical protein ACYC6M_04255 [Terriglobales bacterium]
MHTRGVISACGVAWSLLAIAVQPQTVAPTVRRVAVLVDAAGALPAPDHAAVLFHAARVVRTANPRYAGELLEEAYSRVRNASDQDGLGETWLVGEIVHELAVLNPAAVAASLPGTPALHDLALNDLVQGAIQSRQYGNAFDLLQEMSGDEFAYQGATRLLEAPGPPLFRNAIFGWAVRTYKKNPHRFVSVGHPDDLGSMVVRFWREVGASQVREAIQALLDQAEPSKLPLGFQARTATVTIRAADATLSFPSFLQFRLFQLLPILRQLDGTVALTDLSPDLRQWLQRYPQGVTSLDPNWTADGSVPHPDAVSYSLGSTRGSSSPGADQMEGERQADLIAARATADPATALANADALASPSLRVRALLGVAHAVAATSPLVTTTALEHVLDVVQHALPDAVAYCVEAADLSMAMKNVALARHAIAVGSDAASNVYKADADAKDPNTAIKFYWPSTRAWLDVTEAAYKISPATAAEMAKAIPDDAIALMVRLNLVGLSQGVPVWRATSPIVAHKAPAN